MTVENEQTIHRGSPIILSPWLVALLALVFYGLTLNHWVTFNSLPFAAKLTGWDWHPGTLSWRPQSQYPLFFLLTLPIKWLPMAWRPIGLNIFTAVCAALTLAALARSVRLMSHDRTKEQRLREGGEYALLSVRLAFLPAALAVLMLAGELTFWENATAATVEMLDLLVFAILILCLLDYRISQKEWRMNLFAVVYGMGVANNWALIGFFPCFMVMTLWIKRLGFFNWRFILRMIGWGAVGLSLYLLPPILGAMAGDGSVWDLLWEKFAQQKLYLTAYPRYYAVISGVPTLVPLLFAAIKWPSFEGELSAGAHDITRMLFRVLHIIFLAVCLLMFFDVKLSPSPRYRFGFGVEGPPIPSFLTFYYLAALSVGYFSGYVLLVFGKDVAYKWGRATGLLRVLNMATVVLLCLAAVVLPGKLIWDNYQHIKITNGPAVSQLGMAMAKSLPARPAFVLADDLTRLGLATGAAEKLGLPAQYVFIESPSLTHREYLRYLAEKYPVFAKNLTNVDRLPREISSLQVGDFLAHLARNNAVYYLHPSFGAYFEEICMTPRGMGGDVHPYPSNALARLLLTTDQVRANQSFFRDLQKNVLEPLPALAKENAGAAGVARTFSEVLDNWGVELQMYATEVHLEKDYLADAGQQFAEAVALNPENHIAQVNLQFNCHLRGVTPPAPMITAQSVADSVTSWDAAYNECGPVDEPSLYLQVGRNFAEHMNDVQAAHIFQRCLELAPGNDEAELDLAKTYIDMGLADGGLARIQAMHGAGPPLDVLKLKALAYLKKGAFEETRQLLVETESKFPNDENFAAAEGEIYRQMGYKVLGESNGDAGKENEAAKWFADSENAMLRQSRLINAGAFVNSKVAEISDVTFRIAEVQMMLKQYGPAITNLTTLVRQYDKSALPRLNRAIAELEMPDLAAAKTDYLAVEKLAPNNPNFQVRAYYGLAQIARAENDQNSEVHYSELYLKSAPTNTMEFTSVAAELRRLQGR